MMLALWFESTARIAVWICRCVGTGAHVYPANRYLAWCGVCRNEERRGGAETTSRGGVSE
jgi:hypothetical protein